MVQNPFEASYTRLACSSVEYLAGPVDDSRQR